jgi:hypothetical protein
VRWGLGVFGCCWDLRTELAGTELGGPTGALVVARVLERDSVTGSVGGVVAVGVVSVGGGRGISFQRETLALTPRR